MKRRRFLAASCLAGMVPLSNIVEAGECCDSSEKEYYELRLYRMESEAKTKLLEEFLGEAAVPALNRIGISPVGAFRMMEGDSPDLYVILPHKSLESLATATARLMSDGEFCKAGASLLDAPKSDPAYQRIESSLMVAFDGMPKLEAPSTKDSRVLQLRTYESHSAKKALKKIEMFNTGGEIDIFRRTGLNPVFFGQTLVGSKVPNLTYMLGFDDMKTLKESWDKFMADPAWAKLKVDPAYEDTVSNITNILLRPAPCSQI